MTVLVPVPWLTRLRVSRVLLMLNVGLGLRCQSHISESHGMITTSVYARDSRRAVISSLYTWNGYAGRSRHVQMVEQIFCHVLACVSCEDVINGTVNEVDHTVVLGSR